jgi:hypothetical protein
MRGRDPDVAGREAEEETGCADYLFRERPIVIVPVDGASVSKTGRVNRLSKDIRFLFRPELKLSVIG